MRVALLLIIPVLLATFVFSSYDFYVLRGNSMHPTIEDGSLVMAKKTNEFDVGDVVIAKYPFEGSEIKLAHRVIKVEGDKVFLKGDNSKYPDPKPVSREKIVGKVVFAIPKFYDVISFVRTPVGFLLTVVIPGITLIAIEVRTIIREIR